MSKKIDRWRCVRWPATDLVWTAVALLFLSGFATVVRAGSPESLPTHDLPASASLPLTHEYAPFRRAAPSPYPVPGVYQVRYAAFAPASGVRTRTALSQLTYGPVGEPPLWRFITFPQALRRQLAFHTGHSSYRGSLPSQPLQPLFIGGEGGEDSLVDGWTLLFTTGFEESLPEPACLSPDRGWNATGGQAAAGFFAARPTAPMFGFTEPGQPRWLVCGPFVGASGDRFLVEYTYRLATPPGALFFFGISYDGQTFQGSGSAGLTSDWLTQQVAFSTQSAGQFWVAWTYEGDFAAPAGSGVWLDEVAVWRYSPPAMRCGDLDAGHKGLVLTPYDPTAAVPAPIIRRDDTVVVERLAAADVHWVRLGIHALPNGVNLADYDRMIDTLCAQGIRVLGLLNQETLARQDFDATDEATVASYDAEFSSMAAFLAGYFAGRISDWEIWNEPNLAEGAYLPPARYAHLLDQTSTSIKAVAPHVQVLFGGLASAWHDSYDYLRAVYHELDTNLDGARPFDALAVHPYPRKGEGPDPAIYMFADQRWGYETILDKFLELMAEHGDGQKPVWVTEIGWNSARQSRNRPTCFNAVLVQESDQARYLTTMFDILFHDVPLWGQSGTRAVEKVFWYQYMDVGTLDPCAYGSGAHLLPKDWWFGLYRGDKVTPKPGWCAFVAYPQPCQEVAAIQ
ncbi:MAG: hypothetical protein DCC55_27870 [Chloroflexi bacterium]|nr:MAG: hypothetical protein DCC55_27870 [Chloroflexota bacterium]